MDDDDDVDDDDDDNLSITSDTCMKFRWEIATVEGWSIV